MREILFRAWLIKEKKMVEVKLIHLGTKKIMYGYSEDRFCYGNRTCSFDDCELMEFTGLTDKNGKNIFEGDIVKLTPLAEDIVSTPTPHNPSENRILKVIFFNGMFAVDMRKLWKYGHGRVDLQSYETNRLEVIGNIHDNPELLEVNK